ncbi:MAG: cell wall hydrolase [Candidatus Pacearchaeota archaeon]
MKPKKTNKAFGFVSGLLFSVAVAIGGNSFSNTELVREQHHILGSYYYGNNLKKATDVQNNNIWMNNNNLSDTQNNEIKVLAYSSLINSSPSQTYENIQDLNTYFPNEENSSFSEERNTDTLDSLIYESNRGTSSLEQIAKSSYSFNPFDKEFSREDELNNPGKYGIEDSSETLLLAKCIYAESRGNYKNPSFLRACGESVITRADKKSKSIKEIICEPNQYSFFKDHNKKYFENPLWNVERAPLDRKAWEECYRVAEELIRDYETQKITGVKKITEITHYHDSKSKPKWAYSLKPIKIIHGSNGVNRYCYRLY